ncbi:MAG: hypothetical protein EBU66_07495 [Bacteroidetes bacterium]|nr:hypothetical protein [bacterium]NBP64489.1 hypothetical protein [Bacteroidota bacterium]
MIVQNAVICNKCDDFIVSKHRHDFVTCGCGAISVDGGQAYLRRVGGAGQNDDGSTWQGYTDLSWELPDGLYKACAQAVLDAEASGRNHIGVANAVMRTLRDADRIVADHEQRILAHNPDLDEIMIVEVDGSVNRYKKVNVDE